MNNDETYTPCTKCGRPMAYCKGQCCGKPKGCHCKEYGPAVCGAIRQCEPECPYVAVIPSMVVEHADNLKDLCDTFVHVSDLNTTFYIDDKHRTIITWAGPVEYDNYDLAANSLGLRSQFLIDFTNDRGAYYDKTGNYKIFNFGKINDATLTIKQGDTTLGTFSANASENVEISIPEDTVVRLRVAWTGGIYPEGWTLPNGENGVRYSYNPDTATARYANIVEFEIPDASFVNEETEESLTAAQVFSLLEAGNKVVLDEVPLGTYFPYSVGDDTLFSYTSVDDIELSAKATDFVIEGSTLNTSYTGGAYVGCSEAGIHAYLGVRLASYGGNVSFRVQGCGHTHSDTV